MKKRFLIIALAVLLMIVIIVLVSGPLLSAIGVEVFCVTTESGRLRFVRCGGDTEITADAKPPRLSADARPVIVDTDMAVDDWMAILYLLQRPDIDVQAITVTGAGEAHCGPGVQNALDLVALAGRPEILVTCGRESPLKGEHVFPQSWREDVDELAGISIPSSPSQPHDMDAVELIANIVENAHGEIEIITLGPLTNIAEAIQEEPSLAERIKRIYIMGGAFYVPGNVYGATGTGLFNDVAEWNIYVDPHAAGVVVASGAPITFVPLDASNHVLLDEVFYDRLAEDRNTPESEFVYQVLTEKIGFVHSGEYFFWDPLTAAIAVDESLGTFEVQPVVIIEEEGSESGATEIDENGSQVKITTSAAGERFKQHFLDVLNGRIEE